MSALFHRRPFKHEELVGWSLPWMPEIKINTDEATKYNPRLAGVGSVLKDHHNEWLVGAIHNLRFTTSVIIELWEIYDGLK